MLRSPRVWAGFLITLFFLALFFRSTNFGEIKDAFRNANYALAFASLPVYFLGIWARTMRWQYFLRPIKRVPVGRLYPVVLIGLMANNLLPARAGELVRAFILSEREQVKKAAALGTIAVDRLFDGLTLIPMLVIVAAIVGSNESFELGFPVIDYNLSLFGLALLMAVLFGIGLSMLFVLAFSQAWRDRADALVTRVTPQRFRGAVEGLAHSFFEGLDALRNPADLSFAWIMSTISWMLEATMYYMIGRAFHIDVGFQYFLLITSAANLAISILASQGGVGPFELVTKQVLVAAGVGASAASAFAIGLHTLVLLPVVIIGVYFLGTMGLSLGEMFSRSTAAGPTVSEDERRAAALPKETP